MGRLQVNFDLAKVVMGVGVRMIGGALLGCQGKQSTTGPDDALRSVVAVEGLIQAQCGVDSGLRGGPHTLGCRGESHTDPRAPRRTGT